MIWLGYAFVLRIFFNIFSYFVLINISGLVISVDVDDYGIYRLSFLIKMEKYNDILETIQKEGKEGVMELSTHLSDYPDKLEIETPSMYPFHQS